MTTKTLILLALATFVSGGAGFGQSTPAPRGPMWMLTLQEQVERQQQTQASLAQLRQKKTSGTITAAEGAWLDRMERVGGWGVNGIPRGFRGPGFGWGPRNGTGPRAQMDLCPLADNSATTVAAGPGWRFPGRGGAFMGGWGRGGGRGPGLGLGPRNGTGPRAQAGLCPLANSSTTTVAPGPGWRFFGQGRAITGDWGWRNGTGPRSLNGTCPLLNPSPAK